uniref:Uncharacterized protein n=1 Tax=Rhizophora mucronata TaxID=61149 RepID=A0A2P2LNH7_RHIMU
MNKINYMPINCLDPQMLARPI